MKAAYFTGPRALEIREEPEPAPPGAGEVLVRIERVGVCGSDVHYYTEGRIGDQVLEYPCSLGHECSATVLEVGTEVAGLSAGQAVAIEPAFACGRCDQCRAGREHTCRALSFMGCPGQAPGALRERYVLPASACFALPDGVDLDAGALIEPFCIGLHALAPLELPEHPRAVIFGAGPIGLSVLFGLSAAGPCEVYVAEPLVRRRAVALECGAAWVGDPDGVDVVAAIQDCVPDGVDVVFECSGDPDCIDQAAALLAPGGTLSILGIPSSQRISIDLHALRRREVRMLSVRRQNHCVERAIELVRSSQVDLSPMLTHRFGLDEVGTAFELVAGYCDGVIKAMIEL